MCRCVYTIDISLVMFLCVDGREEFGGCMGEKERERKKREGNS